MKKTFKFLWLLLAFFILCGPPSYASPDHGASVSLEKPSFQFSETQRSAATSRLQKLSLEKSEEARHSLSNLMLGSGTGPSYPTFTKRGYFNIGNHIQVNAWSGLPKVSIPLVHVQGNDGLALNLTYTMANTYYYRRGTAEDHVLSLDIWGRVLPQLLMPNDSVVVGGPFVGKYSRFDFLDGLGRVHTFYYWKTVSNTKLYRSSDHWVAKLIIPPPDNRPYTHLFLEAPNGVSYVIKGLYEGNTIDFEWDQTRVPEKIISPHGKDWITIHYTTDKDNANLKAWSLKIHSTGYEAVIHPIHTTYKPHSNTITSGVITQSNGHSIAISTSGTLNSSGIPLSTETITFSDSDIWKLYFSSAYPKPTGSTYADANYLYKVVEPTGLVTQLANKVFSGPDPKFNDQKDNPNYLPRFGNYRITSYSKSGPGIPTSTWNYSYSQDATTIIGPKTTQLITYVAGGTSGTPQNHYLNGLMRSRLVKDTKSGTPLNYVKYQYDFHQFGPLQYTDANISHQFIHMIPYEPEVSKVTYATSKEGSPLITNTYHYNSDGLVDSETLGAINGSSQTVTKTYFDKEYPDALDSTVSHYLISPTSSITKDDNGNVVDSNSAEISDDGYTTSSTHNGVTTSYTYAPTGNLATTTTALGGTTSYSDYVAGFAQTQTDALGNVSTYKVNPDGTIASYTDPDGNTSSFEYDSLNRLTQMTLPANASGYKDVYSKAYSVVNGEQVTTTTHGQSVQTTTYNALGKPASVTISAPDVPTQTQTFQYDALGRKVFSSYPGDTAGTATNYDVLGRVIGTNWPVSGPGKTGQFHTTTSYPSWDKVVHTNANGSEVETTNYLVGSWNHSLGAIETDIPTSAGEQKTTASLDAMGRMLSVTQGGLTRSYTYSNDGHFWLTGVHNPETGDTHYTYNDVGQVLSSQVGDSGITQNTYNVAGQLTKVEYPDKTTDTFTYTPTGKKATASVSGNGQPNTWTYTYNALDHLKTATLQFGTSGPKFGFSYDYNDSGFMQSATYPDGTVIDYAPNSLGKATKGGNWVNSVNYMADGHEKSFTDASGVTTTYTLNARHMVSGIDFSSLVNSISGDNDVTLTYQYDGDANVTSVRDSRPNHNRTYVYGDANWLTSGTVDGKAFSATYDITGNLLEKDDGGNKLAYYYDKQNRLQSVSGPIAGVLTGNNGDKQLSETFTYDNYGDITSRDGNGTTFNYNDARQLIQANGSNPATGSKFDLKYYYDAMGNRVAVQDVKASTLEYEIFNQKGKLLYKTDKTNATTYIYLNGRKIAESTHPSGVAATVDTSTFFHNDLQGSVVLRSDSSGNILNPDAYGQSYLPYGSELHFGLNKDTLTKSIGEHIGFINKPFNSETGLSYFGARYYDPMIGRFMGTDPVGYVGGASSFNRYAYGNNNPMTYQDPDGNFSWHSIISGIGNDISAGFNDLMHINAGFTYGADGYQPYLNGGGFSYGGSSDAVPSGPSPTEVAGAGIGIITFALGMPEDIPIAAGALLYESFGDTGYFATEGLEGGGLVEDDLSGPVTFRAPPNATEEEIEQVKAYVDGCNDALEDGALSDTGRVSTKGELRQEASSAARREKASGDYTGHAGHVPDTTWTGTAEPHSWMDLSPRVNMSLGGQARGYPIGFRPTGFFFGE